ncbi:hypothetical protein P5673_033720 [Acropora cervicornis]|uniref:Uncharacterized protein n=1 Tax=Acropora cervicornis TaxID=6130 RepID=A0AAD9PPJ2_ACRCE|nr:hypothetical protein P5673_033720 [Acropora cervicornis]
MISLRSSRPNRPLILKKALLSSTSKLLLTSGKEWSCRRLCPHSGAALCRALLRDRLEKSVVAARLFATDSNNAAITRIDSFTSTPSSEIPTLLIAGFIAVVRVGALAPFIFVSFVEVADLMVSVSMSCAWQKYPTPASKASIAVRRPFLDNASSFDLISLISRWMSSRILLAVTSPSFRFSAALSRALLTSKQSFFRQLPSVLGSIDQRMICGNDKLQQCQG